jgi:CDP-paratose 2-epimerase
VWKRISPGWEERHPGLITRIIADVRDEDQLARAAREAKAVFHMAAQVAVTTVWSIRAKISRSTSAGTLNLLMRFGSR